MWIWATPSVVSARTTISEELAMCMRVPVISTDVITVEHVSVIHRIPSNVSVCQDMKGSNAKEVCVIYCKILFSHTELNLSIGSKHIMTKLLAK